MSGCNFLVGALLSGFATLGAYALLMIASDGEFLAGMLGALVSLVLFALLSAYVIAPVVCS